MKFMGFDTEEEAAANPQSHPHKPTTTKQISQYRRDFIGPKLLEKGWSRLQWAMEAEVAYNTVSDYLSGKKKPYPSTRVKLAKALGISANHLPQWDLQPRMKKYEKL
jgi:lambda repressor-like predicted transcriptional regulator